ncbi:MAG TPA: hypothetical protein EYG21_01040 [Nitrospinaceae bacterium]|nr:hypothetical protein [Nitrospinaceae bacterium]
MSMPKGHKSKTGYATTIDVAGGMGYREIAETMTAEGHKMNHSTARNVFLASMKKIVTGVCKLQDETISDNDMYRIAADPRFQAGVYDILTDCVIDV